MAEMFVTLGNWNWLILGFILMAMEALVMPGVPRCAIPLSVAYARWRPA